MNSAQRIRKVFACIRCGLTFNNFHSAQTHYLTDARHPENKYLLSTLGAAGYAHAVTSTIDVLFIATPGEAAMARAEAIAARTKAITAHTEAITARTEVIAARTETIGYTFAVGMSKKAPQQPPKSSTGSKQTVDVDTNADDMDGPPPRKRRRIASGNDEASNPRWECGSITNTRNGQEIDSEAASPSSVNRHLLFPRRPVTVPIQRSI